MPAGRAAGHKEKSFPEGGPPESFSLQCFVLFVFKRFAHHLRQGYGVKPVLDWIGAGGDDSRNARTQYAHAGFLVRHVCKHFVDHIDGESVGYEQGNGIACHYAGKAVVTGAVGRYGVIECPGAVDYGVFDLCLLYPSPHPRDATPYRMPY